MKRTITFTQAQWVALRDAAKKGILAADLLGPDEPCWFMSEEDTQSAHEALALVDEHSTDLILGQAHRAPVAVEAEQFPMAQAHQEGWTIDFCEQRGEHVVRRLEDGGHFKSDDAAWDYVHGLAYRVDGYHLAALGWIDKANVLAKAAANVASRTVKLEAAE